MKNRWIYTLWQKKPFPTTKIKGIMREKHTQMRWIIITDLT